eukprot:gnl/Spiro4/12929_TR6852_c0_g1_i1.p1 gnl/Spiro4/12929_TR6852_c0_g1~~gnl/Spiro4/12929_TR6852_c0_g1_i1.p1  ORF type:complete len:957 (-),score=193.29 gnl/Spiro4/12929_TR6852_c0_g1_i1:197-3067(-)
MSVTSAEFEQAVTLLVRSAPPERPAPPHVVAFCSEIEKNLQGWSIVANQFTSMTTAESKFWCLKIIEDTVTGPKYELLSFNESEELRLTVLGFLRPTFAHLLTDQFLIRKVAVILVFLMKRRYPELWPTFFSDILQFLDQGAWSVQMVLIVLLEIDTEVVCNEYARSNAEIARNNVIKDAMRACCTALLADAWVLLLRDEVHSCNPEIANLVLENVSRYIDWIDINLVVNDKLMPLIFHHFGHPETQVRACECLVQICMKGMDSSSKLALFRRLQIFDVLAAVPPDPSRSFLKMLAKLVNCIASCSLEIWETHALLGTPDAEFAREFVLKSVPYAFFFLNSENVRASTHVASFVQAYLTKILQLVPADTASSQTRVILDILVARMRMPVVAATARLNDDDKYQQYRTLLAGLCRTAARIIPSDTLSFIQQGVVSISQDAASLPVEDIEIVMYLVNVIGEAVPAEALRCEDHLFSQTLRFLLSSGIARHSHALVCVRFFEIVARYARFFVYHPQCLVPVLDLFANTSDGVCIHNPNQWVRQEAWALLLKVLRTAKQSVKPDTALALLEILLGVLKTDQVVVEQQGSLFEMVGILLGVPGFPSDRQQAYLEELLLPFSHQMIALLPIGGAPHTPQNMFLLTHIITVCGHIIKELSCCGPNLASLLKQVLDAVLGAFSVFHNNVDLRSKVFSFLARAVGCLGDDVLVIVPDLMHSILGPAGAGLSVKDLSHVLALLNQLCAKQKAKLFAIYNGLFPLVFDKVMALLRQRFIAQQTAAPLQSEEVRELVEFHTLWCSSLVAILTNELAAILITPENSPHLLAVLESIMSGLHESNPPLQKSCLGVMHKMVDLWGNSNLVVGFDQFVSDTVLPAALLLPFHAGVNLDDAHVHSMIGELLAVLRTCAVKYGDGFFHILQQNVLPQLQCPPELAQEFCQTLLTRQPREMRDYFKNFVRILRQR